MNSEIIIIPVIVISIAYILKVISDNRLRRKLIEKGELDISVERFAQLQPQSDPLSAVKWGLVLVGLGAAIIISHLFPYSVSDEVMFSLMFLFAGIGFIAYYFIAKSVLQRKSDETIN